MNKSVPPQFRVVIGALMGVIIGALIGSGIMQYKRAQAFMGINPDFAKQMETVRRISEDNPKYRTDELFPREMNEIEARYHQSPQDSGPEECRKFKLGPRYTNCVLKYQEVKPTKLPYPTNE